MNILFFTEKNEDYFYLGSVVFHILTGNGKKLNKVNDNPVGYLRKNLACQNPEYGTSYSNRGFIAFLLFILAKSDYEN